MKIFAYILSVYILALIATPCIDGHQDNALQKIEQTSTTTDNHSTDGDHCSPFCTCQCCASPIVFQYYIVQFNCFSFSEKHFSGYQSAYISSPYSLIWQPPKIS